jgi:deoxyribonuclease V
MLLCVDVSYEKQRAVTGCVGFERWSDPVSSLELVVPSHASPQPYVPGQLYKRELPYLLTAVNMVSEQLAIETVVVDGHVWLNTGRPGLGAHLYEMLGRRCPVVGVAKAPFRAAPGSCATDGRDTVTVKRGRSRHPLYVSAAGMDAGAAAQRVREMSGPYRIPTLLKRADQLARGVVIADPQKTLRPDRSLL